MIQDPAGRGGHVFPRVVGATKATLGRLLRPWRAETALVFMMPSIERVLTDHLGRQRPPTELGAHITVLYPFLRRWRVTRGVEAELARLAEQTDAFDFRLTRVGQFPDVVYLAPEPDAPFVDLTRAVVARWPSCRPYRGKFATVTPHLTVAKTDEDCSAFIDRLPQLLPLDGHAGELHLMRPGQNGWKLVRAWRLGREHEQIDARRACDSPRP